MNLNIIFTTLACIPIALLQLQPAYKQHFRMLQRFPNTQPQCGVLQLCHCMDVVFAFAVNAAAASQPFCRDCPTASHNHVSNPCTRSKASSGSCSSVSAAPTPEASAVLAAMVPVVPASQLAKGNKRRGYNRTRTPRSEGAQRVRHHQQSQATKSNCRHRLVIRMGTDEVFQVLSVAKWC